MLAVRREKTAGCPALSIADHLVSKGLTRIFWQFADKHLVTGDPFFDIGSLKDQPFSIITEIGFGIGSPKGKLLHIPKMPFFRILQSILFYQSPRVVLGTRFS